MNIEPRHDSRGKATGSSAALAAGALFLTGCTVDGDPSAVPCDGTRAMAEFSEDGFATFTVHGTQEDDIATVTVRRDDGGVSVRVMGDVTGPPQILEDDGFTRPTNIVDGPELSTFGAGGAWIIDVREDGTVVIQGNCDGM